MSPPSNVSATSPPLNITSPPANISTTNLSPTSPLLSVTSSPVTAPSSPMTFTSAATAAPTTTTTAAPAVPEVKLEFKLEQLFSEDLKNTSSPKFQLLANQVTTALNNVYKNKYGSKFNRTEIKGFRKGSVVVDTVLVFNNISSVPEPTDVATTMLEAVSSNSSNFSLPVNTSSIVVTRVLSTTQDLTTVTVPLTTVFVISSATATSPLFNGYITIFEYNITSNECICHITFTQYNLICAKHLSYFTIFEYSIASNECICHITFTQYNLICAKHLSYFTIFEYSIASNECICHITFTQYNLICAKHLSYFTIFEYSILYHHL
ncbi:uncharacterized protein [Osmerus mordax]|uniref:uncharacterized protein n=1 Tax=Osmerus mordax TaxID=8014 RepID=UPI00350F0FA8